MEWFLSCLGKAIEGARAALGTVLAKARFWDAIGAAPLNARQRVVMNRMLEGSEGKLTTTKWARLAKCSQDTASRDILDLVGRGILARSPEGGRSTSFELTL